MGGSQNHRRAACKEKPVKKVEVTSRGAHSTAKSIPEFPPAPYQLTAGKLLPATRHHPPPGPLTRHPSQFPVGLSPSTCFAVCARAVIPPPPPKSRGSGPTWELTAPHLLKSPLFPESLPQTAQLTLITTHLFPLYLSHLCTCVILLY